MKKVLSLLLSVLMLVSTLPMGMVAYADEKETTVQFSVCDGGYFTMQPSDIDVTADLSDKFAEQVGYNDTSEEPTILDAIIAAHIAMLGADFMDYAPFSAPGGFIGAAFGEETNALSYRLNGDMSDGNGNYYNLNTTVKANDYIEFMFYQDTSLWSDTYLTFDKRIVNEPHKDSVELTLYYEGYDANWNAVLLPASNASVTVDWEPYGTTDKDGKIVINDLSLGRHFVTTESEYNGKFVFLPYAEIVIEKKTDEHIEKRLAGASAYVSSGVKPTVDNATDVLLCAKADYDWGHSNNLAFFDNVGMVLDSNEGKLVDATGNENIATYGAVIEMLRMFGYDTKDFWGYDVEQAFLNMEYDATTVNPYNYRFAIMGAVNDEHAKKLAQELIDNYYVLGKGMNYWGFSCDNTASFLYSIAPVAKYFDSYVKDAIDVIESYSSDKGYFYSNEYTDPNADSTGVALAALSAIGDMEKASVAYATLIHEFESEKNVGVMNYYGAENLYATKDGLLGILAFSNALENSSYDGHINIKATKNATCTADGRIDYTCIVCGEESTERIEWLGHDYKEYVNHYNRCDKPDEEVRECKRCGLKQVMPLGPAVKHSMASKVIKKATTTANGTMQNYCKNCSYKYNSTVYSAKTITLSTTKYTYDGKAKKPSVTIKDSKGNKIASSNYTVSYPSGRKNVGKYTYKITFKGDYSGSVSKSFTIVPKSTSISKLSAQKKGFKATWKKQATQTTGYQIQIATDSKFTKGVKSYTVSKNSTTSKSITKLSAKKKYYARVRTYKTVSGTKYYSSWSGAKTVTTK